MQRHSIRRLKRLNRFLVRYVGFLSLLLTVSVALNVWSASLRTPAPAALGHDLTRPGNDPNQAEQGQDKDSFRIATYNIQRAKGTDGQRDIGRIAAVLTNMDVVGLNELAGRSLRGLPDQAEQLGRRLHRGWLFAPNQRRWYRDSFGNGCLSRLPVNAWHNEPLPYDKDTSQSFRNLLTLHTRIRDSDIVIMVTHLDRRDIRTMQLHYVLDRFQQYSKAVLMGDLNSMADDPQLTALLTDPVNQDAIGTHLNETDDPERVDWIIVRGLNVISCGFNPRGPSDHPCYWVDVTVE